MEKLNMVTGDGVSKFLILIPSAMLICHNFALLNINDSDDPAMN